MRHKDAVKTTSKIRSNAAFPTNFASLSVKNFKKEPCIGILIYIYLFFAHIPLDLIKLYSSWARTKDARGDRRNPAGVVWQTISLGQKHGSTAAYSGQRAACHSSSLSKGPSESSEIVKKELVLTPSNRLCVQGRCKE